MSKEAVQTTKVVLDIEYTVIGNALGCMIAVSGLLAGSMVNQRSLEYWMDDIMLLAILAFMLFRLFRSFMGTMNAYRDVVSHPHRTQSQHNQTAGGARTPLAQLPAAGSLPHNMSPDKVVEEVVKRIEAQKAAAMDKSKFLN